MNLWILAPVYQEGQGSLWEALNRDIPRETAENGKCDFEYSAHFDIF